MASKNLGDLFYTLEMKDKQFVDETKKIQKELDGVNQKMGKDMQKTAVKTEGKLKGFFKKSLIGFAAIGTAIVAVKKAIDFSKEAAKFNQQTQALEKQFGVSADKILAKLREVSQGTISDQGLIEATNRAFALNVTKDVDQIAKLMEFARLRARALGLDTTQAFNDIVTGIGRGSPMILDNLGIITKAWTAEAQATGQAMDSQFILNKVLDQASDELGKNGAMVLTTAEKMASLESNMSNLKLELGQLVLKGLEPLIDGLLKSVGWLTELISKQKGLKITTDTLASAMEKYVTVTDKLNNAKKRLNNTEATSLRLQQSEALIQINESLERSIKLYEKMNKIRVMSGKTRANELAQSKFQSGMVLTGFQKKMERGDTLNAKEMKEYNKALAVNIQSSKELLEYQSSIDSLVQSAAVGIQRGLFKIDKFAIFGDEFKARVEKAIIELNKPQEVVLKTQKYITQETKDTGEAVKKVNKDYDSALFILQNYNMLTEEIKRNTDKLAISASDVVDAVSMITDALIETDEATQSVLDGFEGLAKNVISGNYIGGIISFIGGLISGVVQMIKMRNEVEEQLTVWEQIETTIQNIERKVSTAELLMSAWRGNAEEVARLQEKIKQQLAESNNEMSKSLKTSSESIMTQIEYLESVRAANSDNLKSGKITMARYEEINRNIDQQITQQLKLLDILNMKNEALEVNEDGTIKNLKMFEELLDNETDPDRIRILEDILKNNNLITEQMEKQSGLLNGQLTDLQKAKIEDIKRLIQLGILDPDNVRDIQGIQSALSSVGLTGLDAISQIQGLGVSGQSFNRAVSIGSVTTVLQGVPVQDLTQQTSDQINNAIEGV